MNIDFYHIDAFELANYEPVWRTLRAMGVNANIIAINDDTNTGGKHWFDFSTFQSYCHTRCIPFQSHITSEATLAITTQNSYILKQYQTKVRLMYGPVPWLNSWQLSSYVVQPFDLVLVHGKFYQNIFSKWLPKTQIPIIGYPKYDDFFSGKFNKNKIREKWNIKSNKPIVVFIPSWENKTAFDIFFNSIIDLQDEYEVIIKPHHCTLRFEKDRMFRVLQSGIPILKSAFDLQEIFSGADLVVADANSGALYEAIMCCLPTVAIVKPDDDYNLWLNEQNVDKITTICRTPNNIRASIKLAFYLDSYQINRESWLEEHCLYRDGSASLVAAQEIIKFADKKIKKNIPTYNIIKVSFIIAVNVYEKEFNKTLYSILNQVYDKFEVIIVLYGDLFKFNKEFNFPNDSRIKILECNSDNYRNAFFKGIELMKGNYYACIATTDYIDNIWLENLVYSIEVEYPSSGLVYTDIGCFTTENNKDTRIDIKQNFLYQNVIINHFHPVSYLCNANLIKDAFREINSEVNYATDWCLLLIIVEKIQINKVSGIHYFKKSPLGNNSHSNIIQLNNELQLITKELTSRHGKILNLYLIYPEFKNMVYSAEVEYLYKCRFINSILSSDAWSLSYKVDASLNVLLYKFNEALFVNLLSLILVNNDINACLKLIDIFGLHLTEDTKRNFINFINSNSIIR